MKRSKRIGLTLLVLLVILLVLTNYAVGPIVKTAVEKGGPVLVGVPIKLEKAHFRLLQGVIRLNGFTLGNPEGFKTADAILVNEIAVEFDMKSLFRDTFVIKRIYVKAPEITYELGLGKSNIGRILEKLDEGKKTEPEKGVKKVIIEDFLIEEGRVNLSASLAMGAAAPIPLPSIHLTDIGKEEGHQGASPVEVTMKVFGAIVQGVTQVVTGSVKLIGDGAQAVGKGTVEVVGKTAEMVGDGAGKMVGGVKNLMGLEDKEEKPTPANP